MKTYVAEFDYPTQDPSGQEQFAFMDLSFTFTTHVSADAARALEAERDYWRVSFEASVRERERMHAHLVSLGLAHDTLGSS